MAWRSTRGGQDLLGELRPGRYSFREPRRQRDGLDAVQWPELFALCRSAEDAGLDRGSSRLKAGGQLNCSQGSWAPDLLGAFLYRAPQSLAYQWLLDGNEIGGAVSSTYTATAPGDYTCRVTASNHAGSASQRSAPWTIYDLAGFFAPVDNRDGSGNLIFNKMKAARRFP